VIRIVRCKNTTILTSPVGIQYTYHDDHEYKGSSNRMCWMVIGRHTPIHYIRWRPESGWFIVKKINVSKILANAEFYLN
jgi:hypothetical protein